MFKNKDLLRTRRSSKKNIKIFTWLTYEWNICDAEEGCQGLNDGDCHDWRGVRPGDEVGEGEGEHQLDNSEDHQASVEGDD